MKKKKRANKVGYARDDEVEVEENEQEIDPPEIKSNKDQEQGNSINVLPEPDISPEICNGASPSTIVSVHLESKEDLTINPTSNSDRAILQTPSPQMSVSNELQTQRKSFFGSVTSMFGSVLSSTSTNASPRNSLTVVQTPLSLNHANNQSAATTESNLTKTEVVVDAASSAHSDTVCQAVDASHQEASHINLYRSENSGSDMELEVANKVAPLLKETDDTEEVKKCNENENEAAEVLLVSVLSEFTVDIENLSVKQHNLVSEMKNLYLEKERETHVLQGIIEELNFSEMEQQRFAQLEDFDKADGLSEIISELKTRSRSKNEELLSISSKMSSLELEMKSIYGSRSELLDRTSLYLKDIGRKQLLEINQIQIDFDKRRDQEDTRLRAEENRIAMEKKHVDKEEEVLSEESRVTEDAINDQTVDVTTAKADLDLRLFDVLSEIQVLEKRITAKKLEETQLRSEIDIIDARVHEVRRKYERQLLRIQSKQESLRITKSEWEQENFILKQDREALVEDIKKSSNSLIRMKEILQGIGVDEEIISLVKSTFTTSVSYFQGKNIEDLDSKSLEMKDKISNLRNALQLIVTEKAQNESLLENLFQEEKEIEEKLPKLELDKKTHAAARRFKDAGSVAKEMKDLMTRSEEISVERQTLRDAADSADFKAREIQEELENYLSQLKDSEKENDIAGYKSLLSHIRKFQRVKDIISEKKISNLSLVEPTLMMLDSEISDMSREASDIKLKYFLPDDQNSLDNEEEFVYSIEDSSESGHSVSVVISELEENNSSSAHESDPEAIVCKPIESCSDEESFKENTDRQESFLRVKVQLINLM